MATVQNVTKASSDQLLRKFAELDDAAIAAASDDLQTRAPRPVTSSHLIVKRKRSRRALAALSARELASSSSSGSGGELPVTSSAEARRKRRMSSGGLTEWKSLLPPSGRKSTKAPFLLRRIGIGRSDDSEGLRSFLLAALEKTLRRTFKGASKMFIDKHGDAHTRLISEIV